MKKILLLISCGLIALVGKATLYFDDGTTWVMEVVPNDPSDEVTTNNVFLVGSQDTQQSYLELYSQSDNDESSELVAFVKTEGEKVFFQLPYDEYDEWYLMYDFGLTPEDENSFYCPLRLRDGKPLATTLKCIQVIEADTSSDGWPVMVMVEVNQNEGISATEGKWIKGLGDTRGVLSNYGYDVAGGNSQLIEVKTGDEIIFQYYKDLTDSNCFIKGTVWKYDDENEKPSYDLSYFLSDDSKMESYFTLYRSYKTLSGKDLVVKTEEIGFIKTEEMKVYFLPTNEHVAEPQLIYDFGMQVSSGETFYNPATGKSATLNCVEITEANSKYDGWTTMKMVGNDDSGITFSTIWIKGLGDTSDLLQNFGNPTQSVESHLSEVTFGSRVIYLGSNVSGLYSIPSDDNNYIIVEGNIVTIKTENPEIINIFDAEGKLMSCHKKSKEDLIIEIVNPGIYVVSTGKFSKKIFVR